MCLAVPMRVIAVKGVENDFTTQQLGVVEAQGIEKEVRLDLVDRWPQIGDYLIIHAGFAIHTLARMKTPRRSISSLPWKPERKNSKHEICLRVQG